MSGRPPVVQAGHHPSRRVPSRGVVVALVALLALSTAACAGGGTQTPGPISIPQPVCGGLKIAISGALSCDRLVRIAIDVLAAEAPAQLARGIVSIEVTLATCPTGEIPRQIDCTGAQFEQLVTLAFGAAAPGGPSEPSLTVALEPVSGRLLGISNPLLR